MLHLRSDGFFRAYAVKNGESLIIFNPGNNQSSGVTDVLFSPTRTAGVYGAQRRNDVSYIVHHNWSFELVDKTQYTDAIFQWQLSPVALKGNVVNSQPQDFDDANFVYAVEPDAVPPANPAGGSDIPGALMSYYGSWESQVGTIKPTTKYMAGSSTFLLSPGQQWLYQASVTNSSGATRGFSLVAQFVCVPLNNSSVASIRP